MVFQSTWFTCRWGQTTTSTLPRLQPESARCCRNGFASGFPPRELARLVVADAGVDHKPQPRRLYEQRLGGRNERTILLGEVRKEPGAGLQHLRRRLRNEGAIGAGDQHHAHKASLS